MIKIKEYVKVKSLDQAYELNQKKSNRILGGMLWMKMGHGQIHTAIDLSGLGLDQIEETEEAYIIGCMTTLRQLELHEGLEKWSGGTIRKSVESIVGVQFRNLATVGGSIFGRFGFSDVLTCLLALDTHVELYQGGIMSLDKFVQMPRDNDILVRLIVRKTPGRHVYLSHRNTKTDFPVLAMAVSVDERGARVVAGARPGMAMCVPVEAKWQEKLARSFCSEEELRELAEELAAQIPMGSNMRGSSAYRTHLAKVLIRRGLEEIQRTAAEEGGQQ